jgi:phosphatidylglycerophosphate synthase
MSAAGHSAAEVALVDCPLGSAGPSMRLCGMTLLERHVREARQRGAARLLVRASEEQLAGLDLAALGAERLPPGQDPPGGARVIRGDELLGMRVEDARSRRRAEWALLQTCRRPYDGPGDRFFIRTFSLRITRLLTRTPITPTQVTYLNAAVGVIACVLVGLGGAAALAAGGAGLVASVILDSVDGELARVRHMTSRHGMIVDNVSDDLVDNGFVLGLGLGVGGPWAALGAAAAVARWLVAARTYLEVARAGVPGDVMAFRWWFERGEATTEVYADLRSPLTWARSIGRRDTYCLVLGGLCVAGLGLPALLLGAAICTGYFVLLCLHLALGRAAR